MINDDDLLFLAFSDLTCHLDNVCLFSGYIVSNDSKETELRRSNRETSQLKSVNTGMFS